MTAPALTLDVTREDRALGQPSQCGLCPIALAARRRMPFASRIEVYSETIEISLGESPIASVLLELPAAARLFIERFDAGDPVEPLTFSIPLNPNDYDEAILIRKLAETAA